MFNKEEAETLMNKSFLFFATELAGIRVGRASVTMLDSVHVDAYGQKTKIAGVASINVLDNATLLVKPYDRSQSGAIARGIQDSGLGVGVIVDGDSIRVTVPKTTEETRKELVKTVKKMGENEKVQIRQIRQEQMQKVKALKDSESEDVLKKYEAEIQKHTDAYIKKIDETIAKKADEVMAI